MKPIQLTRVFEYNGTRIPDPNPALNAEKAVELIAQTRPELTNPKIDSPVIDGELRIYRIRVAIGDRS